MPPQSGRREFAAEVPGDLPSLTPGAIPLIDVTVSGAKAGDLAQASLVSSTRFIKLNAAVWSNSTVRVMARNISGGHVRSRGGEAVGGGGEAARRVA